MPRTPPDRDRPRSLDRSLLTRKNSTSTTIDECRFYHTLELPTFGRVEGTWDLTGRFDDYVGRISVTGKRVLDIGTASGFLTWESEARGATVTSFDVETAEHLFMLPIRGSERIENPAQWRSNAEDWIRGWRNGYWLAHEDLGSQSQCIYGNVYEIGPALGSFDVVLLGQLLVHVPDAITALAAAASVCEETLVVTEGSFPVEEPLASLCGRADLPDIPYAWYHYSHGWYREVLTMLGFASVAVTTAAYLCNQDDHADSIELATVVATR